MSKKPSSKKAYRISLVAAYNNDSLTPEQISDSIFEAMLSAGNGLAMVRVESVKPVRSSDRKIAEMMEEFNAGEVHAGSPGVMTSTAPEEPSEEQQQSLE